MPLRLEMVTVDSTDPLSLARWWATQVGGAVVQENEGWFVVVALPDGGPRLAFQRVDDPTPGKNRMHLDLSVDDVPAAVEGLLAAGATMVAERQQDGFTWVTLADPDGNQFCVAPRGEAG